MKEQATRNEKRESVARQICQGLAAGLLFWGGLALIAFMNL